MFFKTHLFNTAEKKLIVEAISKAELLTSGEIRVHVEPHCKDMALDRAVEVFQKLKMYETTQQNGVLIYVAYEDKKVAIIGDKGINQVVPADFWKANIEVMTNHFKKGDFLKGILYSVEKSGQQLAQYFPHLDGDKNELSNDISEG